MKKMKKLYALVLTFVMILGMSMTTMAANTTPAITDNADITVLGIETGAEVKAYKIVKADYNKYGLLGYSKVEAEDNFDIYNPDSSDIAVLATKYRGTANGKTLTEAEVNNVVTYTLADQEAGTYLILVEGTPTAKIYNPMVVSLGYKTLENDNTSSGSVNELQNGQVNADDSWTFGNATAYVKSSVIDIQKEANVETQEIGGIVEYTVTTTVPNYGVEYTEGEKTVKFEITDTFTGLALVKDSITVKKAVVVEGASEVTLETIDSAAYTITGNTENASTFKVAFTSDWIMENANVALVIGYKAVMTGEGTNKSDHDNNATLTYTRTPGVDGSDFDIEKVYTFDIDGVGEITKDIIKKVKTENDVTSPLAGAEFTLFTDEACTTQYTNTIHVEGMPTAISDDEGRIAIKGLNAETAYYLKETKAPLGYTVNDQVYKILITSVEVENEELISWDVQVSAQTKTTVEDVTTYTYSEPTTNEIKFVNNSEVIDSTEENAVVTTTNILNTKIIALPSTGGIGTTIFTVMGCVIMVTAAGLFIVNRRREAK